MFAKTSDATAAASETSGQTFWKIEAVNEPQGKPTCQGLGWDIADTNHDSQRLCKLNFHYVEGAE